MMFDPIYKELSEKAKILYSFLSSKIPYFEMQTELAESGMEGTKSYRDENNEIYLLAGNTELIYILNCSESTLIRVKKELKEFSMLHEEPMFQKANRIYPLKPSKLTDRWTNINEIINMRNEKK